MKQYIKRMIIDEDKHFALTHYFRRKGIQYKKDSDHNTLVMDMNIPMCKVRKQRTEHFNFRNLECQKSFFEATNQSEKLVNCFSSNQSLPQQCNTWFKELNSVFHQSFKKIRINGKIKETEFSILMKKKKDLKQKSKVSDHDLNQEISKDILEVETQLAALVADKSRQKVIKIFGTLTNDGSLNMIGMWDLQRKIFPKNPPNLPTAKIDVEGKIVTSHRDLQKLYLDTFVHRLRHRPIKEDYAEVFVLKEQLCKLRLEFTNMNKSPPWTKLQLLKVLSSLKNNKSRDPHGIVNELFKPGVAGDKLISSLLIMFNRIKNEMIFPEFMRLANICSIYKGRGERMLLESDRGIFIVNCFRNILMKMVYQDKYEIVDKSMSDSNVGARKKKSIRNHIFVINAVINEAIRNKSRNIDILIKDYRQCFDSMWLKECINDLYESGVTDNNLNMIFEANRLNKVAVNTPAGITAREEIEEIVLQGEVFGPLQCSVQVDTFGKECLEEGKFLYKYKGCVDIPPLAMVDDLLTVSECEC